MDSKFLFETMNGRRSYREFLEDKVDMNVIRDCIKIAGTAPSGANKQPWFYALVENASLKAEIRKQAEEGERIFYEKKISTTWKEDLQCLNVNYNKPFLTQAPLLICCFQKSFEINPYGEKERTYYPGISASLSIGFLLMALHLMGYATLTYTPSNPAFLHKILDRPEGEKPLMIVAVGKKNPEYVLPDIQRKEWKDIAKEYK